MTSNNKKVFVTLYTDASHLPTVPHPEPNSHIAGWVRSDNGRTRFAQPVLDHLASANEAEMTAVVEGVTYLLGHLACVEKDTPQNRTVLVIRTDSQHTIARLGRGVLPPTATLIEQRLVKQFAVAVAGFKGVVFKHVKGHSGKDTTQSWLNDWCDTQCKKRSRHLSTVKLAKRKQK